MQPSSSTTSARTPYRAASTPPRSPVHLRSPSPLRHNLSISNDDYPESPTRGTKRLPSPLGRPPPFALAKGKGKWRPPKFWRNARRAGLFLALFALLVLGIYGLKKEHEQSGFSFQALRARWSREEEGLCRFVSPVEAYHRDLERLRLLHPHLAKSFPSSDSLTSPLTSPANHTHPHHPHHTFSSTGHLLVSPKSHAPHPIPLLLGLGEKRWEELLSRQSRTLEEANAEYIRRYGRRPPRGFDIWWDFAVTHGLVLPDEYDRINLDLAPFFALPKEEMRRRMELVENMAETFTIVVKDGRVAVEILDEGGLKWDGTLPRARDAASLIDIFARFLPDLKATFSIFDQPQIYLSWARRSSLVELGLRGEHTTHLQETDSAHVRLSRSCPPDSHLRTNFTPPAGQSFIYDALEANDICQNPYVVPIHGLTLEPHGHDSHPRPHTQLLPLFSLAKTSINSDILITPLDQFYDNPGKDPKWEDKSDSRLAWRGSPTGISMMTRDLDWRSAHRIRLHSFANNRSEAPTSFMVPNLGQFDDATTIDEQDDEFHRGTLSLEREEGNVKDLAEFFYNTRLAGGPLQCAEEDGTCQDMRDEIKFAPFQKSEDLNKHKFLLDVDGNGWSGRFRRLMSTNSVVIKASLFSEWFQPHLIPWFMYIPAKLDYSDLPDILSFFRGSPRHPDLGFDETAKALAVNGKCFAERMFRIQDLQAYMMRLFLEYARLTAEDGLDMDFYLDEDDIDDSAEELPLAIDTEGIAEGAVANHVGETPGSSIEESKELELPASNSERLRTPLSKTVELPLVEGMEEAQIPWGLQDQVDTAWPGEEEQADIQPFPQHGLGVEREMGKGELRDDLVEVRVEESAGEAPWSDADKWPAVDEVGSEAAPDHWGQGILRV